MQDPVYGLPRIHLLGNRVNKAEVFARRASTPVTAPVIERYNLFAGAGATVPELALGAPR